MNEKNKGVPNFWNAHFYFWEIFPGWSSLKYNKQREGKIKMKEGYFNVADIFGESVFNDTVMQERLPKKVYQKLKKTIEEGKELDLASADIIAHEMKEWAIEQGATHYTHWFQPLTGVTA